MSFRTWLYREGRPRQLARLADRLTAALSARGLGPDHLVALEVAGRRSGRTLSVPLVVADLQGERYLVSMLGTDVNWVHNVRAAGGAAALRHGGRERVHLEEVPPPQRAAVLRTYLGRAPNAREHFPVRLDASPSDFEGIVDWYPVFRVAPRRPIAGPRR
jgi:F420H(2)-dependent quinone reductase